MIRTLSNIHLREIKRVTLGKEDISINEIITVSRYNAEVLLLNRKH